MIRLQKFLAQAGLGSRRHCEQLILQGDISVDGATMTQLGVQVDPDRQTICFNGIPVKPEKKIYIVLNKPKGIICTNKDIAEKDRPKIVDLLPKIKQRLFPVGRLDVDSSGLIILTNDGELCNQLTHPRYEVPKTYHVTIKGFLSPADSEKVQKGIWLAEGRTSRSKIYIIKRTKNFTVLTITLREGRNREVRRIFAALDHPVTNLIRIKIGGLSLGKLKPGQYKIVSKEELLKHMSVEK